MTPKEQAEELMGKLVHFAEQELSKYGEFYPFGAEVETDGKVVLSASYNGKDHPSSQVMIEELTKIFQSKAKAGKIKAAAIVYDMRIQPPGSIAKTDAICFSYDHKEGYTVNVFFPYTLGADKKVIIQPLIAAKGKGNIFGKNN